MVIYTAYKYCILYVFPGNVCVITMLLQSPVIQSWLCCNCYLASSYGLMHYPSPFIIPSFELKHFCGGMV